MNGAETNSPLELIHQKERELAQRLREARNTAEQKLAGARSRGAEIRKNAESEGRREGEEFFRQEMMRVEKAAEEIQAAGKSAAERLRRLGSERLDRAIEVVIESLFPE